MRYSVRYRDTDGTRDWAYFTGIKQLTILRSLYEHPLIANAVEKQLYISGKTEVEQSFKNGKLNGMRKIYYPNGQLYLTEEFENGKRIGFRNYYTQKGILRLNVQYKNGLIRKSITYQDTVGIISSLNFKITHNGKLFGTTGYDSHYFQHKLDSLRSSKNWGNQISSVTNYSKDGNSYAVKNFDYKGDVTITVVQNWKKQTNETYHYKENGKLEYYTFYDNKNDRQIEYDYAENGSRIDFLNNCEFCFIYFRDVPAATAEAIYIQ